MGWVNGQQVGREKKTVYTDDQGKRILLEGDRPWRNNNPQDLRYPNNPKGDAWLKEDGGIGRDKNGFGIFPDYDTGLQAMKNWWRRRTDERLTIEQAVEIAAPKTENDVEKYCRTIERETGLPRNTRLDNLSSDEWLRLYRGVQQYEGYYRGAQKGRIIELSPNEGGGSSGGNRSSGGGSTGDGGAASNARVGWGQGQSIPSSPLILDLNGDGVKTTNLTDGAYFDHDKNGFAEQTAWASADDGILVLDRNNDGIINDGGELFGNGTILQNGQQATDGFQALAELDGNQDGIIDANDSAFSRLKIWQDVDGDGYSSPDELYTLDETGVQSITTVSSNSTYVDLQGNEYRMTGSFTKTDGTTSDMADVWFKTDKTYTIANDWLDVPDDIAATHNISPYDHRACITLKEKVNSSVFY